LIGEGCGLFPPSRQKWIEPPWVNDVSVSENSGLPGAAGRNKLPCSHHHRVRQIA
jgi:hypothetical protein